MASASPNILAVNQRTTVRNPLLRLLAILAAMLAPPFQTSALAGPAADDLGKCMVRSTSKEDRALMVRWIFMTAALHPNVESLARISSEQRQSTSKSMAGLVEQLIIERCRAEFVQAVRAEGPGAVEGSLQLVGQLAAQELLAEPRVMAGVMDFTRYLDRSKFADLVLQELLPR
jgi:hypothetical protein